MLNTCCADPCCTCLCYATIWALPGWRIQVSLTAHTAQSNHYQAASSRSPAHAPLPCTTATRYAAFPQFSIQLSDFGYSGLLPPSHSLGIIQPRCYPCIPLSKPQALGDTLEGYLCCQGTSFLFASIVCLFSPSVKTRQRSTLFPYSTTQRTYTKKYAYRGAVLPAQHVLQAGHRRRELLPR